MITDASEEVAVQLRNDWVLEDLELSAREAAGLHLRRQAVAHRY